MEETEKLKELLDELLIAYQEEEDKTIVLG